MPQTYSEEDLDRIAAAIDTDVGKVLAVARRFESAANWYRQDQRSPHRPRPSTIKSKLKSVIGNSRRLLKSLGITDPDTAMDGPTDPAIIAALEFSCQEQDGLARASERLARMVAMLEALEATTEIHQVALQARQKAPAFVQEITHRGHRGDDPLNNWIEAMLVLYEEITGKGPGTSVRAPGRPGRGKAEGPLSIGVESRPLFGVQY